MLLARGSLGGIYALCSEVPRGVYMLLARGSLGVYMLFARGSLGGIYALCSGVPRLDCPSTNDI